MTHKRILISIVFGLYFLMACESLPEKSEAIGGEATQGISAVEKLPRGVAQDPATLGNARDTAASTSSVGDQFVSLHQAPEISLLYVYSSARAKLKHQQLTLEDVHPQAIAFTDRPYRMAAKMPVTKLIAAWDEGPNSFEKTPPNAELNCMTPEGEAINAIVELMTPVLNGSTLKYQIRVIEDRKHDANHDGSWDSEVNCSVTNLIVDAGEVRRRCKVRSGHSRDLSDCNLSRAQLQGVQLSGAILVETMLAKANLKNANLESATCVQADLSGANLSGANLKGAQLTRADFSGAILTDAVLENAHLVGASFNAASLIGANLQNVDLTTANLVLADLKNANLRGALLSGAKMGTALLFNTDLSKAVMMHANLDSAVLNDAKLGGANLTGADLSGVSLEGATCDVHTIWPDGKPNQNNTGTCVWPRHRQRRPPNRIFSTQ